MKKIRLLFSVALMLCATLASAQKYVGGDISMLKKFVDEGAVYKDKSGNAVQPLTFCKEQGWNAMRVRLFVDPSKASTTDRKEGAIQDLDYVIALGKDIKQAGFKFMLDFHYSDTWTDPGQHSTPSAWSSMTAAQLSDKVYAYTKDCLEKLVAAGATPDFIQPGNEITYGMLWPTAHVWPAGGGQDGGTWENFTAYLASGIKACKEICPQAKIVIQTEMSKTSNVTNFYNQLAKYPAVHYDIIGISFYPDFHGSISVMNTTLTTLENQHSDKKIMIVETGYAVNWQLNGAKYDFTSTYPLTEEGQRKFAADFITMLNSHKNVNGLFWWYPEYNLYNIVFPSKNWAKNFTNGYWNASLFNLETGRVYSAFYELKNFRDDDTGVETVKADGAADDDAWYTIGGSRLNGKPASTKGIYINHGRKVIVK